MKRIGILLLCLFVSACSVTKVHLYSRYLSEHEVEKITKNLEEKNFDVIVNAFDFPSNIQQSTVLYSPFIEEKDSVDILMTALNNLGFAIPSVQPLFSGNHFYTKNSLGLLLLPEGAEQSNKVVTQSLINDFSSQGCDMKITLSFHKDGSYLFNYSSIDPKQTGHLSGRWKITSYPYIELVSLNKEWHFYFEIEKKSEVDVVGKINLMILKPVERYYLLPNCSFVYGERQI